VKKMTTEHRNKPAPGIIAALVFACLGSALPAVAQMDGQIKAQTAADFKVTYYPVKTGIGNRDVAPAADGTVWFANQFSGTVGRLDPKTGKYTLLPMGAGSSPHGILMGPDGNVYVMDGGQNAIIRVDSRDQKLTLFRLPKERGDVNLNTGVFDHSGALWFTGQNGFYGRVEPASGKVELFDAPGGEGPYGITVTPNDTVWYTSFAGNHIVGIDPKTLKATVVELPDPVAGGARRIWADSKGRLWLATWGTGELLRYDPADNSWAAYKLPGLGPRGYSVYVDEKDFVWVSEFMANAILRFDPATESFIAFPSERNTVQLLQMAGRGNKVWGGEQGANRLVSIEPR
jgi:virginiamycin B lyase